MKFQDTSKSSNSETNFNKYWCLCVCVCVGRVERVCLHRTRSRLRPIGFSSALTPCRSSSAPQAKPRSRNLFRHPTGASRSLLLFTSCVLLSSESMRDISTVSLLSIAPLRIFSLALPLAEQHITSKPHYLGTATSELSLILAIV